MNIILGLIAGLALYFLYKQSKVVLVYKIKKIREMVAEPTAPLSKITSLIFRKYKI